MATALQGESGLQQQGTVQDQHQALETAKQTQSYLLLIGGFLLIFAATTYTAYRRKKKINLELTIKTQQILKQKEEIIAQNAQLKKQQQTIASTNEELHSLIASLEVLSGHKDRLMDYLANAINEPLYKTIGMIHFIKESGGLSRTQQRYIEKMEEAIYEQEETLRNLLKIELLESRQMEIKLEKINALEWFEQLMEAFENNKVYIGSLPEKDFAVQTDVQMLNFISTQLILNAVKVNGDRKEVLVKLENYHGLLVISVCDQGEAIPENLKEPLFLKYRNEQPDNPFLDNYPNLPSVKIMTDILNGSIELQHPKAGGNVFVFKTPLQYTSQVKVVEQKEELVEDPAVNERFEKVNQIIREKKLFQDPEITLQKTADEVSLTLHELSHVVNRKSGTNFQAFINQFRVEEAQKLLLSKEHNHLSLIGIGFEAGFNSKSSFFSTFKKITGKTPSEYRKSENPL